MSNFLFDFKLGSISRRSFLARAARTIGAASTLLLIGAGAGKPAIAKSVQAKGKLSFKDLTEKYNFRGKVLTPDMPEFDQAAFGELWNQLRPTRHPQVIVQVTGDADVIAAVNFARDNNLKVTVRGGGHNWCSPSLRNNGMLIDLVNLNKVVSIDVDKKLAIVEPIISNRDIQKHFNAKGLSYPSGHCPEVKLSGYLLSGGMAWNHGEWGPGVGSIEAIELVTPKGELIKASAKENEDYFFAARGGGCSFFGVALRYHLRLYDLPKAISASVYHYPYEHISEIGEWLSKIAPELSEKVELSLFALPAPDDLMDKVSKEAGGKIALVTATMFANSREESKEGLALLETCPFRDKALKASVDAPATFPELFDASGSLWPPGLRSKVDAMFSNESLDTIFDATKEHYKKTPSRETVFMFAIFTGKNVPHPRLTDAAFSMTARLYGGPWTMWKEAKDDAENIAWHEKCVEIMLPMVCGHYVSESDTVAHPDFAKASFVDANWHKLNELKAKHDPTGLFFDFKGGLT